MTCSTATLKSDAAAPGAQLQDHELVIMDVEREGAVEELPYLPSRENSAMAKASRWAVTSSSVVNAAVPEDVPTFAGYVRRILVDVVDSASSP